MELNEMFSECHAIFADRFSMPEEIEIDILLCKDREELFTKRIKRTDNLAAREHLLKNKDKYIKADGCFITPPVKPNHYTVLITHRSSNEFCDTYDYIHELSHVCNHYFYMHETKQDNPFATVEDTAFYLWDEFRARYMSTIVILQWLNEKICEVKLKGFCDTAIRVLRQTLGTQSVTTYDGSQYLGFVAAMRDLNMITDKQLNNYFQSEDEKLTYNLYFSLGDVSAFLQSKKAT